MPSIFSSLQLAPPDPILSTALDYKADPSPNKVNLGIGAYRTNNGKPFVLPVVKRAEEELLKELLDDKIDKEYIPIDGLPSGLKSGTQNLIFGEDMVEGRLLKGDRIASVQTLSGTGSLRVCGEFILKHLANKIGKDVVGSDETNKGKNRPVLYYSQPTWGNHMAIFQNSGGAIFNGSNGISNFSSTGFSTQPYPYWKEDTKSIDFSGMLNHFSKVSQLNSVYLIHPCAHNPTGLDPTKEQWKELIKIIKERGHVIVLDSAYQGYASGSLEKDREVIRMFVEAELDCLFLCQSFAKNLGLYGERIGMLHVVCQNKDLRDKVLSQLKLVIRPMYSSPPCHGALLVSKILNDKSLYNQWVKELKDMADRILSVREGLRKGLELKGTPGKWNHITDQIGMFSFTGLNPSQCEKLIKNHHIYLLKSGRISLAGLNTGNLSYVVNAIDQVVREG